MKISSLALALLLNTSDATVIRQKMMDNDVKTASSVSKADEVAASLKSLLKD